MDAWKYNGAVTLEVQWIQRTTAATQMKHKI